MHVFVGMQAQKVLVPLAARRAVPSPESGAPRERDPAQQRVPETRTGRTRLSASRPSPIGGGPHDGGRNVGKASQARGAGSRGMLIAGQLTGRDRGRMKKHRIGALVAAAALTLTFAGAAFANGLHQDTPIVGTQYSETTTGCAEGWHFVHTGTGSADLPSELTAAFTDAG